MSCQTAGGTLPDKHPASSSATSLVAAFRSHVLSPVDVVDALISRVEGREPIVNAVTTPAFEAALRQAVEAERRWSGGVPRPLEGVPVLVKDLIDTAGLRTTRGSVMFADHVPATDADVVAAIRRAGGIVLGKAATHEFGWGITTDSPHFGVTRNPWSPARISGGSSGGSAAALAAEYAPLAVGTDTAGSVRLPAAFCGVSGLRPTFGAVPVAGVQPLAPSLDSVGPMARTVQDLRLLWSVIAPSRRSPVAGSEPFADAAPVSVGLLLEADDVRPAAGVAQVCSGIAALLADAGVRVVELDAGEMPHAHPLLRTVILAEGLRSHVGQGLWPDRAGEYGADVRARLELAEEADPGDYLDAQRGRAYLRSAWAGLFTRVDLVLSPAAPLAPPPIAAVPGDFRDLVMPGIAGQSLAGLPALVMRAGFDATGLPVGIQLTARAWHEELLFDVGELVERLTDPIQWRRPGGQPVRNRLP
ncbi:amidase [Pseudonocardia sp. CA-142604]|uniref:amidase n=1 Tax=Pseudonocardia sp. CA-142604 TaxID=3240024 RepID=UPI003D8B0610